MPIDPVSDGTWIAVNEAGLIATLLNTYQRPAAEKAARDKSAFRSRGTIVPMMMTRGDAREAAAVIEKLNPQSFPPFLVIAVDGKNLVELTSDGRDFRRVDSSWDGCPLFYTTSGLGDEVVNPPRRALFDEFFSEAGALSSAQDRFHRHQWPDRPHISVCMSRAEARTVSTTIVEVGQNDVAMAYQPVPPSESRTSRCTSLARTQRV